MRELTIFEASHISGGNKSEKSSVHVEFDLPMPVLVIAGCTTLGALSGLAMGYGITVDGMPVRDGYLLGAMLGFWLSGAGTGAYYAWNMIWNNE